MSGFIKELVLSKMKQLTAEDIRNHAKDYGFSISEKEAKDISTYLKNNKVDPFNKRDRKTMLQELAQITNVETAKKANKLFNHIIKKYGLGSLLE